MWPRDTTCRHRSGSTFVQIMACCLRAPSHYLNQLWLIISEVQWYSRESEMCSERDSPLKRLYRRTHAKLTRLAGFGQLVWAAGCELSLALVHARRPAWPGETSKTILRVAPPCKTRPPDHTRVNWPVDASVSGSAQVGATDEPREFRLAGSRQAKRLERAIPLTTHLCVSAIS